MSQFDPLTLTALYVVSSIMGFLCLFYVWRAQKTYGGFGEWVAAGGAIGAGGLLLVARGTIPEWFSIMGGNTLLIFGYLLQLHAGRVFLRLGRLPSWVWWTLAPVVITFGLFTFIWPNLQARILVGGLYAGCLLVALAWVLLFRPTEGLAQASRFTGAFILATAILTLLRGVSGLFGSPTATYFDSSNFVILNGFLGTAFQVAIPLGILMINQSRLEEDLAQAKKKMNTLRGFIPICSSCKKIRSDEGFWTQLEVYIRDHSEAEFTHGICPECKDRLYPGLDLS